MNDNELEDDEMFWHSDNSESRIEATADVWDEYADEFFADRGWTKPHMAYDVERGTGTLWVMTQYEPELWEDTGISAREGDSLLCDGWDNAEADAYDRWREENGFPPLWGEEE
jgi:hypothetical protein